MVTVRRRMHKLGGWLLTASALGGGCTSFTHRTDDPQPVTQHACQSMPRYCRNHVYIFFVNGIDPLGRADFAGVRDYVQSLGFIKTYYGQFYHAPAFAKEMRRLHHDDPNARFVLVGFEYGTGMVNTLAASVKSDNVFVDLVVNIGGGDLQQTPEQRPDNVARVVQVQTNDEVHGAKLMDDAVNLRYSNVPSVSLPAQRYTLDVLANELSSVAGKVPFVEEVAPKPGQAPTMPRAAGPRDEWDFLKPQAPNNQVPPSPSPQPTPKPKEPAPLPMSIGRL